MSDDEMMDEKELPPLRMATPGEYERLAKALRRHGVHDRGCLALSPPVTLHKCSCGLDAANSEARKVVAKLSETLDQELAREKREGSGLPPPDGLY